MYRTEALTSGKVDSSASLVISVATQNRVMWTERQLKRSTDNQTCALVVILTITAQKHFFDVSVSNPILQLGYVTSDERYRQRFRSKVWLRQTQQDRQCTYNVTLRRASESLLPWKSNKYYIFCLCMRACLWVTGQVCVCLRISACSLANPACNAYAPYCDVICGSSEPTTFFAIIS